MHRYFFYFGLVFNVILTIDAVVAFRQPGIGIGVSVGTVVLIVNATLLWLYSPQLPRLPAPVRRRGQAVLRRTPSGIDSGRPLTPLNARHMLFAWMSLVFVAFTDLYVRLVASGTIPDYGFHF